MSNQNDSTFLSRALFHNVIFQSPVSERIRPVSISWLCSKQKAWFVFACSNSMLYDPVNSIPTNKLLYPSACRSNLSKDDNRTRSYSRWITAKYRL